MLFRTYYGFYVHQFFNLETFLNFVATVFEKECCVFGDIVKTHLRFIVENLINIGSSYPEILGAELDL
jgi:hypothetical protein